MLIYLLCPRYSLYLPILDEHFMFCESTSSPTNSHGNLLTRQSCRTGAINQWPLHTAPKVNSTVEAVQHITTYSKSSTILSSIFLPIKKKFYAKYLQQRSLIMFGRKIAAATTNAARNAHYVSITTSCVISFLLKLLPACVW